MTKEERTQMLNELFDGIGRVVEEDDRFICYVDKKTIEDCKKCDFLYQLEFYGIPTTGSEQYNVDVLEYRLNKPVYYIIDGFYFDKRINISSCFDCKVIFKNCTFKDEIKLLCCVDVEFENNTYKDDGYLYYGDPQYFLTVHLVNKLSFRNDNFINSIEKKDKVVNFGMLIRNAKEVEFVSTRVDASYPISINADTIKLDGSTVKAPEFDIRARSIENKQSRIKAVIGVMIDNEACDFEGNVKAPIVIYNGEDVTNYASRTTFISRDEILLRGARVSLIDTLKQIRDKTLRQDTRGIGDIMGVKPNTKVRKP